MELAVTFFAGMTAGLASSWHCAAMCGPLASYVVGSSNVRRRMLAYQLSRVGSYTLLGAMAGGLGFVVSEAFPVGGLYLLAGLGSLLLLAAALRVFVPKRLDLVVIRRRNPGRLVVALKTLTRSPLLMGAGSGLLPCGVLWLGLSLASAARTPLLGAVLMAGFATASSLGTIGGALFVGRFVGGGKAARLTAGALFLASSLVFASIPLSALLNREGKGAETVPSCPLHAEGRR